MKELIEKIETLKQTEVGALIRKRVKEFKKMKENYNDSIFKEMCFCFLTANFNAEKSIKIQNEISDCFLTDNEQNLEKKLKEFGHRFPSARAKYICQSQSCKDLVEEKISKLKGEKLREWIVKNIKGLGYKEASHFLRNIGYENYAIVDFHIIDLLVKYDLIKRPKTITKKKYIEIERVLKGIAKEANLNLAELDLYLWYMETRKILK